jgi:hypothetical protein
LIPNNVVSCLLPLLVRLAGTTVWVFVALRGRYMYDDYARRCRIMLVDSRTCDAQQAERSTTTTTYGTLAEHPPTSYAVAADDS